MKDTYFGFLILCLSVIANFVAHKQFLTLDIQGKHTWRQSATMWNVRNFIHQDGNILNPRLATYNEGKDNIVRLEFPLMQWSLAKLQSAFGENIFVVRVSLFILGIFTVLGIFFLVQLIFDDLWTSLTTAILFQCSPLFYYYNITPIPDNLALSFSVWYVFFIVKYSRNKNTSHLILASICLSISALAKLPFLMFFVISLVVFKSDFKNQSSDSIKKLGLQLFILSPVFLWYMWVIPQWGPSQTLGGIFHGFESFQEFFYILGYHVSTTFPLVFLSPIILPLFLCGVYIYKKESPHLFVGFNALAGVTFVFLILELNVISTIHDYYMFPFLVWMYLIVALAVKKFLSVRFVRKTYAIPVICILAFLYTFYATKPLWSLERTHFNPDFFIHHEQLEAIIPDTELCIMLNDHSKCCVISYQVKKQGFVFDANNLQPHWVEDMILNYDVKYMYSDSRIVDSDRGIRKYIKEEILEAGSVKVFRLIEPEDID